MTPKLVKTSAQLIARQPWFPAIGKRTIPYLDKLLYKATRGRIGTMSASGFTGLLLTTTGRKTGKERSAPLLYVAHQGKYYLTGSNWGQQHHPAWTANLIANPDAEVSFKGVTTAVRAHHLTAEEKAEYWPHLVKFWPNYDVYVERSGRDLRVFRLDPR